MVRPWEAQRESSSAPDAKSQAAKSASASPAAGVSVPAEALAGAAGVPGVSVGTVGATAPRRCGGNDAARGRGGDGYGSGGACRCVACGSVGCSGNRRGRAEGARGSVACAFGGHDAHVAHGGVALDGRARLFRNRVVGFHDRVGHRALARAVHAGGGYVHAAVGQAGGNVRQHAPLVVLAHDHAGVLAGDVHVYAVDARDDGRAAAHAHAAHGKRAAAFFVDEDVHGVGMLHAAGCTRCAAGRAPRVAGRARRTAGRARRAAFDDPHELHFQPRLACE